MTAGRVVRCVAALLGLVAPLGACSIAESTLIDPRNSYAPPGQECSTQLGSYALPRAFLHVVVVQASATTPPDLGFSDAAFTFDVVRRPDPTLTFCLDFLESAASDDDVAVNRTGGGSADKAGGDQGAQFGGQFLASITVNATDQTAQIIRALIRAGSIIASGNPNFRDVQISNSMARLADLEFDPFDVRESARANARLSEFGICLLLEGFTFDTSAISIDAYCNSPALGLRHPPRVGELYDVVSRQPVAPHTPGVLYRPRQTFRLGVYRKPDRTAGGSWVLTRTATLSLENLSPVISVGISRAVFAGRRTALVFSQGVLRAACVSKSSEVEGFVSIPYQISRSIVAVPTQMLQLQIDQVAQSGNLVAAEKRVLAVQQAQLNLLKGGAFTTVSGVATADPNSSPFPTSVNPPTLPSIPLPLGSGNDDGLAATPPAPDFDASPSAFFFNNKKDLGALCKPAG